MKSKPTLYRHFDADGALLYVGVSMSCMRRFEAHMGSSEWLNEITKITLERFDDRASLFAAERAAIEAEKPLHNVIHAEDSTGISRSRGRWRNRPDPSAEQIAMAQGFAVRIAVIDAQPGALAEIAKATGLSIATLRNVGSVRPMFRTMHLLDKHFNNKAKESQ